MKWGLWPRRRRRGADLGFCGTPTRYWRLLPVHRRGSAGLVHRDGRVVVTEFFSRSTESRGRQLRRHGSDRSNLVLESGKGCREGGKMLRPTAVRVVVFQEVRLVDKVFLHFSLAIPVLFSISVSLFLEVRLQTEVKTRRREWGHAR